MNTLGKGRYGGLGGEIKLFLLTTRIGTVYLILQTRCEFLYFKLEQCFNRYHVCPEGAGSWGEIKSFLLPTRIGTSYLILHTRCEFFTFQVGAMLQWISCISGRRWELGED